MRLAFTRYVPAPDRNAALRARIVALARVDRLYTEARLQVKRRRRKKVPQADRQPLVRPQRCNEVWSADFVFDRTAEGRVLKCLTIVDDATTEAVAIVPARALGGLPVTRVFERLALERGLPRILGLVRVVLQILGDQAGPIRLFLHPGEPVHNDGQFRSLSRHVSRLRHPVIMRVRNRSSSRTTRRSFRSSGRTRRRRASS